MTVYKITYNESTGNWEAEYMRSGKPREHLAVGTLDSVADAVVRQENRNPNT